VKGKDVEGSSLGLILLLPVTALEILWKAAKDLRLIGVLLDVETKEYKSEGRSALLETIKLVPNKG
jgi:hypothetical protein